MESKYFGQVSSIPDENTVVVNKGSQNNINIGDKFLIIKVGEMIYDPETKEPLEHLEIICGKVQVTSVQNKLSTMQSCEYEKDPDTREIKKTTKPITSSLYKFFTDAISEDETIEFIKPGNSHLKPLNSVSVGDFVIRTKM